MLPGMAHEYDEHFGAYRYICGDWARHVEAYEAAHPGTLGMELEGEEGARGATVERLELGDKLMDIISAYGIVRYSHLDEGDNCCPTCGNEIGLDDAIEVRMEEAQAALRKQKAVALDA
jgi:hypothetical protein